MNLEFFEVSGDSFLQMGLPTPTSAQSILLSGGGDLSIPLQPEPRRVTKIKRIRPNNLHSSSATSSVQLLRTGGLVGGPTTLLSPVSTPLSNTNPVFQVLNPISTGVVVNYIIDQNGSHIPVIDAMPLGLQGDNLLTWVATSEPDVPTEPEIPSHILDHMYAKKVKDPAKTSPAKKRRRVKKKEPVLISPAEPPVLSQSNIVTSPNLDKKVVVPTPTTSSTSINVTQYRPSFTRPNILQGVKGSGSTTHLPPTIASVGSFQKYGRKKSPLDTRANFDNPTYMISSSDVTKKTLVNEDPQIKEASSDIHNTATTATSVNNGTEGDELCFMLTSDTDVCNKTDEPVITLAQQHEPSSLSQENEYLTEYTISLSPTNPNDNEDQQQPLSNSGTFLYEDQQIYFSY